MMICNATLARAFCCAVLAATSIAVLAMPAHASTNLITNGDFASCAGGHQDIHSNLAGWTTVGGFGCNGFGGTGGSSYLNEVSTGNDGTLTQIFADTAGVTYILEVGVHLSGAEMLASIDGTTLIDVSSLTGDTGWTNDTASFVGTGSDTVVIDLRVPYNFAAVGLVSVSVPPPVPEPASIALFGLGAGALGLARRRRAIAV